MGCRVALSYGCKAGEAGQGGSGNCWGWRLPHELTGDHHLQLQLILGRQISPTICCKGLRQSQLIIPLVLLHACGHAASALVPDGLKQHMQVRV